MKVRMGTTQSAVRISDKAINPADNIDVIAVLAAAAQMPETICMEEPEPEPTDETDYAPEGDEADGDNVSRIGHLDDNFDDDDDFATSKPEKKKEAKPTKPKKPKGNGIFSFLRNRISDLVDEGDDM